MVRGKSPIDMIVLTDLSITTRPEKEDFKFRAIFIREDGAEMGTFEGNPQNCYLSETTQETFKNLYESLEKDIYHHLFTEVPKEEEEKKVAPPSKLQQLIDNDQYDV